MFPHDPLDINLEQTEEVLRFSWHLNPILEQKILDGDITSVIFDVRGNQG